MRTITIYSLAIAAAAAGECAWKLGVLPATPLFASRAEASENPRTFEPPPDTAIPADQFGEVVKFGEKIFRETGTYAPQFVGNELRCSNCHLQAGRQAGAAPMWAAYVSYPAYRSKNGHVNSFQERLQGCFRYSMNGKVPKLGDPVLVALESYSYFLAKGLPTGEVARGKGFPELAKPESPPDFSRGAEVYAQQCAACHGAQGLGQSADDKVVFPALGGPQSFNWGAGMASIKSAAEFIHANMPLGMGGSLTPQQAWDVATYIDSQVRPQDPRFVRDVTETRKKFHDSPFSMYGQMVNGAVLGDPASTPPAGTVPTQATAAPEPEPDPPTE